MLRSSGASPIQTDKYLFHNQLDIVLINYTIDIAMPIDENLKDQKLEKN